jgi:hypothetical protein
MLDLSYRGVDTVFISHREKVSNDKRGEQQNKKYIKKSAIRINEIEQHIRTTSKK